MPLLREPKEIKVIDDAGTERTFYLHKFGAWDGLEISMKVPAHLFSAAVIPKAADWLALRSLGDKIMTYVGVKVNGNVMALDTPALVENFTMDWKCLGTLLKEEVQYNNSFFCDGRASDFLEKAFRVALQKISEQFTHLLGQSLPAEKQPSTNSAQSTP